MKAYKRCNQRTALCSRIKIVKKSTPLRQRSTTLLGVLPVGPVQVPNYSPTVSLEIISDADSTAARTFVPHDVLLRDSLVRGFAQLSILSSNICHHCQRYIS